MSKTLRASNSTRTIQAASTTTSGLFPKKSFDPRASDLSGVAGLDDRYLRNASIIDQDRINQHPVAIVGVGAIGSHLAEILCKLGVRRFTLIDPDEVDSVNLSVQGFYEAEVGLPKTAAIVGRLRSINRKVEVTEYWAEYCPDMIQDNSVVFSCVDSIRVRRLIFRHFCERPWPVFFDGRMSAESLQVFCIDRTPEAMELYRASLFPSHEAHRETCTARSTIYCASFAAAILCAQFKKWVMEQSPEPLLNFDLFAMDCFR